MRLDVCISGQHEELELETGIVYLEQELVHQHEGELEGNANGRETRIGGKRELYLELGAAGIMNNSWNGRGTQSVSRAGAGAPV